MIELEIDVKVDTKNLKLLRRKLNRLDKAVQVGFFDDKPHPHADGMSYAAVALVNEMGTQTDKGKEWIPSRPFLQSAIKSSQKEIVRQLQDAGEAFFTGTGRIPLGGMKKMLIKSVKNSIDTWSSPPNSPATIRKKGENNPLIETGALKNAVEARLVNK